MRKYASYWRCASSTSLSSRDGVGADFAFRGAQYDEKTPEHRDWRFPVPRAETPQLRHAVGIAEPGGLAIPPKITVRSIAGEKYDRIVAYELGEMPEPVVVDRRTVIDRSEVPF